MLMSMLIGVAAMIANLEGGIPKDMLEYMGSAFGQPTPVGAWANDAESAHDGMGRQLQASPSPDASICGSCTTCYVSALALCSATDMYFGTTYDEVLCTDNGGTWCGASPGSPSSPSLPEANVFADGAAPTGATLELTGDRPRIGFGETDAPVCELSLDRATEQLVSSCPIHVEGNRRRLHESEAENGALKARLTTVEAELVSMKAQTEDKLAAMKAQTEDKLAAMKAQADLKELAALKEMTELKAQVAELMPAAK